jgi:putative transposase
MLSLIMAGLFNTDQGSQFTGAAFTSLLGSHRIAISMDGEGAWRDNVFVERLWRSVKYEEVYLRAYEGVSEALCEVRPPRGAEEQLRSGESRTQV